MSDPSLQRLGATVTDVRERVAPASSSGRPGRPRPVRGLVLDRSGRQRWETVGASSPRRNADGPSWSRSRRSSGRHLPASSSSTSPSVVRRSRRSSGRAPALLPAGARPSAPAEVRRCRVAVIDADAIANLVRDLEHDGLHAVDPGRPVRPLGQSSIENYLKPLAGSLAFAARRGWIPVSPFSVMTADDRPTRDDDRRDRTNGRARNWGRCSRRRGGSLPSRSAGTTTRRCSS